MSMAILPARWPWQHNDETLAALSEAQQKACEIESLRAETERNVARIVSIRRENHLGATFKKAYRGKIA